MQSKRERRRAAKKGWRNRGKRGGVGGARPYKLEQPKFPRTKMALEGAKKGKFRLPRMRLDD